MALKFTKGNQGFLSAFDETKQVIHLQISIDAKARKAVPFSKSGKNKTIATTHGNTQMHGVTVGLNVYGSDAPEQPIANIWLPAPVISTGVFLLCDINALRGHRPAQIVALCIYS